MPGVRCPITSYFPDGQHNVTNDDKTFHRDPAPSTRQSAAVGPYPPIVGFRIKSVHGEGGMARVYLANDESLDRMVAIKMMSSELSADSEFRIRFDNEAKIVAKFRHPNIVSVHASGEIDAAKYIVMEFVNGGNLFDRLSSGSIEEAEVIDFARQLADALAYSHERGIIHRDIKPGNILFTDDNTPVLTDFGIAKSTLNENASLTKVGMVMGSLQYMAPEQARGMAVTDRTDIYSFGVVIYEMLTGDLPTTTLVDAETEDAVRSNLSGNRKDIVELVCSCLQFSPEQRPAAAQCLEKLNSITQAMQSTNRWADPGPKAVAIAASGFLMVIAAGLVLAAFGNPPFAADNAVHTWFASFAEPIQEPVQHSFDVEPQSATLYLNGLSIDNFLDLRPGIYEIVAINTGYFGRIIEVTVGNEPAATAITLESITLPAQAEFDRFVSAIESPQVMMGDTRNIIDPVLSAVLELKRLSFNKDVQEVTRLTRQLELLASFDDQAAAVSLYLAADSGILERDSTGLLPRLRASMDSGYALATFLDAIRLRDDLQALPAAPGTTRHVTYCDTMQRAYEQGLKEIARKFLDDENDCAMLR